MILLFDQNLSPRLARQLDDLFPASQQVTAVGLGTADDRTVWQYARANGFTIVTQDSDFFDLSSVLGPPPKILWLRCGNQRTATIERLLRANASRIAAFDADPEAGCLEIL